MEYRGAAPVFPCISWVVIVFLQCIGCSVLFRFYNGFGFFYAILASCGRVTKLSSPDVNIN